MNFIQDAKEEQEPDKTDPSLVQSIVGFYTN